MLVTTDMSLFQSTLTVTKAVNFGKENNVDHMVLSDDNLSGSMPFYYATKEAGIKPIFGVRHILDGVEYLFISKSSKGYSELLFFETKGYNEEIFNSDNLFVIAIDIVSKDYTLRSKLSILRDDSSKISIEVNKILSTLKVIDTFILNSREEKDFYGLSIMESLKKNSKMQEEIALNNINLSCNYKKDETLDAMLSTCIDDYKFGDPTPPKFKFSSEVGKDYGLEDSDDELLFKTVCFEGLQSRFKGQEIPKEYVDRLNFEIDIINKMKFPGYFLIVWDFVNEAHKRGIPVGPGRGSAAGALVAYSLRITNIDPMKYGLLFERFLNPERISFPDIDQDFCKERRQEIIDYVINKYGADNVGQVITFGKLAAKSSVKDVTRVMNLPLALGNSLSKKIPETPGMTLALAYKENPESWDEYLSNDFYANQVMSFSRTIEGLTKNRGIHAAALVISNNPLYKNAPIYKVGDVDAIGFDGTYLEDVDLVKYDFLGLKTLTVIDNAIKFIKKNHNVTVNFDEIDLETKEVYSFISTGQTLGLFQIESKGMQELGRNLKPSQFEDLIAMLALYRPGPMQAGMLDSFINRKHGKEKVDYFFKEMEEKLIPILKPTYGMIVYQEQVMQIVQTIGGFSLGGADVIRRAMGKKKVSEMERISLEFADGAAKNNFNKDNSIKLFQLIEKFAGYGFNKSHSAAYALITFQTAWLKLYYPKEFFAAIINAEIGENQTKMGSYIKEAQRLGIEISKPNIFTSSEYFVPLKDKILFGTKSIKSVGGGSRHILETIKDVEKTKEGFINYLNSTQINPREMLAQINKKLGATNRKINSLNNKIETKNTSLQKLVDKLKKKPLTQKEFLRRDNLVIEIATLNSNLAVLNEDISSDEDELKRVTIMLQDQGDSNTKIVKDTFVNLSSIGAFDDFNLSRKSLVENLTKLLSGKCPMDIDINGEDFTSSEIIAIEQDLCGVMLTNPFKEEDLALLRNVSLETQVGILLNKIEKITKKGKPYFVLNLVDIEGNTYEASDFNGKSNVINEGDVVKFTINRRGNFSNIGILERIDLKAFLKDQKPADVTVSTDTNPQEAVIQDNADIIVKNKEGKVIAILSR